MKHIHNWETRHSNNRDILEDFPAVLFRLKFHKKYRQVEIFFYDSNFPWTLPVLPRELLAMLDKLYLAARKLDAPLPGIELSLVNDGQISFLNQRFLGRVGPTNILSFPAGPDMAGSLILSLPSLGRECRLYGQDGETYLLHLLAHGIGHLCGYGHGPEMDEFIANLGCLYSKMMAEKPARKNGALNEQNP